jgi:hypothetical protein
MTTTKQGPRLGKSFEEGARSLAATSRVQGRRVHSRVRLTFDRRLVENDALTTEGRSRLSALTSEPAEMQVVLDLAAQRRLIPEAVRLLVVAADRGAILMFEGPDGHVARAWENAVRAGGVSPW